MIGATFMKFGRAPTMMSIKRARSSMPLGVGELRTRLGQTTCRQIAAQARSDRSLPPEESFRFSFRRCASDLVGKLDRWSCLFKPESSTRQNLFLSFGVEIGESFREFDFLDDVLGKVIPYGVYDLA